MRQNSVSRLRVLCSTAISSGHLQSVSTPMQNDIPVSIEYALVLVVAHGQIRVDASPTAFTTLKKST